MTADLWEDWLFCDLVEEAPPHLRRKIFAVYGVFGVRSDPAPKFEPEWAECAPERFPLTGSEFMWPEAWAPPP